MGEKGSSIEVVKGSVVEMQAYAVMHVYFCCFRDIELKAYEDLGCHILRSK